MGSVLLARLAETSSEVAASPARSRKVALLAACLRAAGPAEAGLVVAYLSGQLRQRRTGVGYTALRDLPTPAAEPSLTVAEVDAAFERIAGLAGPGSQTERHRALRDLLARATAAEQRLLVGLGSGELRQGALEGVVVDALAAATRLPPADVRRAVMLRGAVGPVAEAALADGAAGLARFRLEVGRPVQPMLAQSAPSVADAFERVCPAAVEDKLDGVRIQAHRAGAEVRVFTRSLDDITARLPEVVAAVRALPPERLVLDGEAVALDTAGRPHPFQRTASRVGTRDSGPGAAPGLALSPYFFDVLHVDGEDLLGHPGRRRYDALARVVPEPLRMRRLVTADPDEASVFYAAALARGHEGVLVKSLDAAYEAGRRGTGWIKVKPRHTLDLVVLAAEWGSGRRRGWLSNLHLGARDPVTGGFVMLGKTFKGLTDAMLAEQTDRLLALEVSRTDRMVQVRPEFVVEVAFDGVQTSSRYPGGMALRFARVLRFRPDKAAAEADSVDAVRAVHRRDGG